MADNQDDSFNASKAEVFEALGHPTRIRILQELSEKPLAFSELKRAAGLESNGLLSFHLGKLGGLVRLNPEGAYALTDEGREALRMIEASRTPNSKRPLSSSPALRLPRRKAILVGIVLILLALGSVAVYQQQEQIAALNREISSNTVTIDGARYWHLSEPVQSVITAKSVVFEGVNFTALFPFTKNYTAGTEITMFNLPVYPLPNATGTSGAHIGTFLPEIAVKDGNGQSAYWNQFTITIGGKTPLSIAPEHVNITFTGLPPSTWLAPQGHPPFAGIGWDESTGIITFYVSAS